MAKKKKANKSKGSQGYYTFPDFMEVTPEIRAVINRIKNPFMMSYVIDALAILAGITFLIIYHYFPDGILGLYYVTFGLCGVVYGLVEGFFSLRKNLEFNKFKKREKFRIIWIYDDATYDPFYQGLKNSDSGVNSNRVVFTMMMLIFLTLLLLIFMQGTQRIIAIPFGLVCIGVVFVTSYIMPRSYIFAAKRKPYISLVDDDMAFSLGRYYRWEKALVQYRNLSKKYGIDENEMRISYQEPSILGKKTPTFQVLMPNNDPYTIAFAKHVGKRINQERKRLDKMPKRKKDILDKAFEKLIDESEDAKI